MTDKELLELAAKAHGGITDTCEMGGGFNDVDGNWWDPLEEDRDAFRLAVKLNLLRGYIYNDEVSLAPSEYGIIEPVVNGDPYAATRRAITRAAAEIGRVSQ